MATKDQLLKFKESKGYRSLIKKNTNRRVALEEKLIEAYRAWTDSRKLDYNMHHHFLEISKVFRKVIDEVDNSDEGGAAFISELVKDIEKYEEGIVGQVNNGYGVAYTAMQITKSDLERSAIIAYKIVGGLLDGMIASLEQPQEKSEEWAF